MDKNADVYKNACPCSKLATKEDINVSGVNQLLIKLDKRMGKKDHRIVINSSLVVSAYGLNLPSLCHPSIKSKATVIINVSISTSDPNHLKRNFYLLHIPYIVLQALSPFYVE